MATLYHNLGIDTTIADLNGRPQYVAEIHEPIRELARAELEYSCLLC